MNENVQYSISLRDLFSKQLNEANKNAQNFNKTVSGISSTLATLGVAVGFGAVIKGVIDTGSSFEKAEVQLKTLLKSSSEAKDVFNQLRQDATTSPFGFETLLKGNAALISTGVSAKNARTDFDALANAIAATGGGEDELSRMAYNLQQIKNVGATAADIKQFGMAGINIYGQLDKYAAKYGVTIDKHHITYEQITGALKLAAQEGGDYYNALNNMSETTGGKLSNLSDSYKNFQYMLFTQLKPTIDAVVSSLTGLMNFVIKHINTIKLLAKVVGVMLVAWAAWKAAIAINVWWTGLSTAAIVLNTLATEGAAAAQIALNIAMAANPVGMVILALGALAAAILIVIDNNKALKAQYNAESNTRIVEGVNQERDAVQSLAKDYQLLGMSKSEARKQAVAYMKSDLSKGIGELEDQIGHSADPEERANLNQLLTTKMAQRSALSSADLFEEKTGGAGTVGIGGAKSEMSKASGMGTSSGTSHTTITINIKNLIEAFTVTTNNLQGTSGKIKEEVVKALLSAVTDAQIVAGN